MSFCVIEDCERPKRASGMCNMHYRRIWRYGRVEKLTAERRFHKKVHKRESWQCWEWTGARQSSGYGTFYEGGGASNSRFVKPYRWFYSHCLSIEIPDEMHMDHLCRNTKCVNPEHLEPVTPLENQIRKWEAIRAAQ